jgi:uncharacterized repeat protein (TIGR03803 family)
MSSGIRSRCSFVPASIATLAVALILTLAPEPRAQTDVPAAAPIGTETILYNFGEDSGGNCNTFDDGAAPKGSLTYTPATGLLFGATSSTTSKGNGRGTLFQIAPDGTGYQVDHFFAGGKDDGNGPRNSAMTLVGTVLYGTTLAGGPGFNGTIFSIMDDGTDYSSPPLFEFQATAPSNGGDQPYSTFALSPTTGVLYGMTAAGGKNTGPTKDGDGTLFSFDPTGNVYTRLHNFGNNGGAAPHGQPIIDPNGVTMYGMTGIGGMDNVGVVYSFDEKCSTTSTKCTKTYRQLHNFSCPNSNPPNCSNKNDGAMPDHGNLVQVGTTLYGLTTFGGKYGNGALFSISTKGKHFTILQSFGQPSSNDGINPLGSLTLNDTTLYGTTQLGGNKNNGTVFQINTDGTGYTRVYDFQNGNDGVNPYDNVILLNNTLYGMTEAGGVCGEGTVFAIALP